MVSILLVGAGLWALRRPIAGFFIGQALAERGIEADFRVSELGFSGASLADMRFGSATAPDARIARVELDWAWRGLSPRVRGLRLIEPRLRLRIDQRGQVSAGAFDRLRSEPSRRRPSLPAMRLDIENGVVEIDAPFGAVEAPFQTSGVLGRDFTASARIDETTRPGSQYRLRGGAAALSIVSRDGALEALLSASAGNLVWDGVALDGFNARVVARLPMDLSRLVIEPAWTADAVDHPELSAREVSGALMLEARAREDALTLDAWRLHLNQTASWARASSATMNTPALELRASGVGGEGRGDWTARATAFEGVGVSSRAPSATGQFSLGNDGQIQGRAAVALARAQLTAAALSHLRTALPAANGAPVGPTFAQARAALERAGANFALSLPLAHTTARGETRIWLSDAAEARAASGAVLRLQALRPDTPAFAVRFPGATLQGALEMQLGGGGAPSANLLLDTISSSAESPFEGDGTLSLNNWRADGASIEAEEIGVSISLLRGDAGRIDLNGPLRITGPLGDGEVRDMNAALDLAIVWDKTGWRAVSNNGCQAVRLASVTAAGLAFSNGALALCPLNGALIAADARGALSGGFSIQRLALAGRMAGPAAQPARMSATNVIGRFRGRAGAATLALEAQAPTLAIDLAEARTLEVRLRRLTADAQLAREWRVTGAFEQGLLTDPNLPGAVSAIAGEWSAAPEDGRPIVRVAAGEALLTANQPATDAERPLFNPLRMVETTAELRDGDIIAEGAIVLVEGERRLARFSAHHDVSEGVGQARISAENLQFGPSLQPYEITERMRGLVENVRGPASVVADVDWTNATIAAQGHVRLDGVSLATSTIPVVEDVRGDVFFDDLFLLTTPPGQAVTVGLVNPGVAVNNGRVRFQLLTEQRVSIEQADFDFASGTLAMAPTTITLGAEETRFALTLRDVDAAGLLAQLNVPDLSVTGRIEGEFPLLLTRRSAFIQNGVLRAQETGTIAYTGNAGAGATGAAAIAFDALKSFRYDQLELTLDGDLSGEVVSSITFSGENSGRPVDLGPIAPIPGVGSVTVRGVPFDFNVRVTAPFRRLAQTVASITDPGAILNGAREEEPPETVDPAPSPPR